MMSQKASRREKDSLTEFESQSRDLRQQLGEQLRCLENKVETENAILSELQEFLRRRAEIENAYGKQLERLCRQMLTQHKSDRAKRENWRNYSTFRCWQAAVLNARSVSQDHVLLGEMLGSHVATRLGELIEDSQRLFRKCKAMHTEYQEELYKSLIELQTAMKTYHAAFGEFATAQQKLSVLESQREKLQAQLVLKQKRSGKEKDKDKDRLADKHERGSGERLSMAGAGAGAFRRQDSESTTDTMNASVFISGSESHSLSTPLAGGSQRESQVQPLAGASSSSALFSLSFVCGSSGSQDSPGGTGTGANANVTTSKNSSSASDSPRDSALQLANTGSCSLLQTASIGAADSAAMLSVAASSSLKSFGSSSTLTKKLKSIERQCDKKRTKYSEYRAKALRSRNDYLLTLEACNASMGRLFTDDIPDLIDCMNCGYHTSLCNSMLMQLYAEAALAQTHQNNVETVGRCCSHLDARDDKQRFLKERTNYAAFNAGRRWPFQGARGDPNAPAFVTPPINSVLQDELLARCASLRTRLDQLRVEADVHCKSLRDSGTRLLERLASVDYDVSIRFDSEHRRDALVASPLRFPDSAPPRPPNSDQHRASTDSQSQSQSQSQSLRPSNVAEEEQDAAAAACVAQQAADAFNTEKRREARGERIDLETTFLAAFRKYVTANQHAARVHSQLEAVQRALLDNADYVRLAHSLARAQANASQRCSAAPSLSGLNAPSGTGSKSHTDILIRLVRAPIEKPRRRRLLKAPTLVRPRLFGGYLDDYVLAHGGEIPTIVTSCVRVLARYGLHQQGLFRVSGAATDINEMRAAFERGEEPLDDLLALVDAASLERNAELAANCETESETARQHMPPQKLNAVASLLKLYFRELAEPLFPTELFDDFVSTIYCLQLRDFQLHPVDALHAFIARLRELVATLSHPVRATMRYLFAFLKHVSELCEDNMMDPANLAICFGPTLMPIPDQDPQVRLQTHVNDLVKAFIVYAPDIFDDPALPGPIYDREALTRCRSEPTSRLDTSASQSQLHPQPQTQPQPQPLPTSPAANVSNTNALSTGATSKSHADALVDTSLRSPVGTLNGTLSRSTRNLTSSTLTLTRAGATVRQSAVVVVQVHATASERDTRPALAPVLVDASTQTNAVIVSNNDRDLAIEPLSSDLGASLSSTSSQTRLVSSASMLNDPNCSSRSPSNRTNDEQASPKSSLDDEAAEYDMGTLRPDSSRHWSEAEHPGIATVVVVGGEEHGLVRPAELAVHHESLAAPVMRSQSAHISDLADSAREQATDLAVAHCMLQKNAQVGPTETLLYAAASSIAQPTRVVAQSLVQHADEPTKLANVVIEREPLRLLETDIIDVAMVSASCTDHAPGGGGDSCAGCSAVQADLDAACAIRLSDPNSAAYAHGAGGEARSRASLPSIAESAAEANLDSPECNRRQGVDASTRQRGEGEREHERDRRGRSAERDTRSISGTTDEETDASYEDEERLTFDDDGDAQISEAVAACDYEAGTEQEVSFHRGDTILLFARLSEDWWTGVANGQEGLIPHRYISVSRNCPQRCAKPQPSGTTTTHQPDQSAVCDDLPPPTDDSLLGTFGDMNDDRQIDEALEQAMNGIDSLESGLTLTCGLPVTVPMANSAVRRIAPLPCVTGTAEALASSPKDDSPDSDFPLPPTPNALTSGYDELLDEFVAESHSSGFPMPEDVGDEDNDVDDELVAAATRQQEAVDMLDDLAARYEEMRVTPTNADADDADSSAHSTLSRDGDSAKPRSLAEVFAKTDHPTMRKGTSLASNSSSSVDNANVGATIGGAASQRPTSHKDLVDTASLSSVRSAPTDSVTQHAFAMPREFDDCLPFTAFPVFISRVANEPTNTHMDLRKSASPDLPSIDQLAASAIDIDSRSRNQSSCSLLLDDASLSSKRSSIANATDSKRNSAVSVSDSNSNLADSSLASGLRRPPPAVMPKPKPPQRTSSLFPASPNTVPGGEQAAGEPPRNDDGTRLSVSAKRAMFETSAPTSATD